MLQSSARKQSSPEDLHEKCRWELKMVIKGRPKQLDPFIAGWEAAMDYIHREWGPEPTSNPNTAKQQWTNTCEDGHTIRVKDCAACKLIPPVSQPKSRPMF